MRSELGELSEIEAVSHLVSVKGLSLVDVGCGAGATTRALAEQGATVIGIEPDPIQAERNRAAVETPGVTFIEAGAEAIPVDDDTVDGVLFFRSMHHVPAELMDQAIHEAARILKPDGFLLALEPGLDCTHFEMMRPFNDETKVRTLAQEALDRTAETLFEDTSKYTTMQHPRWESYDAMVTHFTGLTFHPFTREMVDIPEVRQNFEQARTDNGYVFDQNSLINLYRRVSE
jgi:ubiquinone/menaquinone biosynthesis C-methylase UbiE